MNQEELKHRTKTFALRVIKLTQSLPKESTAQILGRQLLRCTTSVGANYRAACRAKSQPDFIAKMGIVEEEADESIYWMELLIESNIVRQALLSELMQEANELLSITITSIKTARTHTQNNKNNP